MKADNDTFAVAPEILLRLRENTGYSEQQVAKKLSISTEELGKIEKGRKSIPISLLKKISEIYQYPLVTFFEEKAPEYPHKLKDYRINRNKTINPEVKKAERRAYFLINMLQEISEERSKLPEFSKELSAIQLAEDLREKINLERPITKKADNGLEIYKSQLENKLGILIIESPLKNNDVRAFSINSGVSIIVLNENDKPEIKLFSLFHELCHLIQRSSVMCSIELNEEGKEKVEVYCDRFASEILIPTSEFKMVVSQVGTSEKSITDMSTRYFVSKQVIMLKLLYAGLINSERYSAFKRAFDEKLLPKAKFGKRNWEKVYFKRVGKKTVETVKGAHRRGKISTAEALDILNIKSKYAEKFIGEGGYHGSK